jgi:hypothetical protein
MSRLVFGVVALVVANAAAAAAQETAAGSEPTAALVDVLMPEGLDEVVLDTSFRFAAAFNARPAPERRGARIVGVAESFFRAIAPRVAAVHGPSVPERAREHLRTRLTSFLDGYVAQLIDEGVRDIELRRSESIDSYLGRSSARDRCNQIPCAQPPCCKDCSAPAGTPPACPAR